MSYEESKQLFIQSFNNFIQFDNEEDQNKLLIDLFNGIDNIISFMINFSDVIYDIGNIGSYSYIQVVNYIEFVFDNKLYDSLLDEFDKMYNTSIYSLNETDRSLIIGIITVEHIKYHLYNNIHNKLNNEKDNIDSNAFDEIINKFQECKKEISNKIKELYNIHLTKYYIFDKELQICYNIIKENNFCQI